MSALALAGVLSAQRVLAGGIIDTDLILPYPGANRVFYCSDSVNQSDFCRINSIGSQAKGDIPPADCGKAVVALDNYELSEQLTCLLRQPYRAFCIEIFPEGSRPSGSFHWNCALSKTIMDRAAVLISRYS